MSYVSESSPSTAALASAAVQRLKHAFRPATLASYTRMFKDFLAFLHLAGVQIFKVNTILLLSFMEFLHSSGMTHSNVANHMAGIRAMMTIHGLSTQPFKDDRVALFVKALKINAPLKPRLGRIITVDLLSQILHQCHSLRDPLMFRALYSFAFFSILRMSNILPHSSKAFDVSRHLARGDLIFHDSGCTIIIKWSKANQTRSEINTIVIPALPRSPLCPVVALKAMFQCYPAGSNDPLFVLKSKEVKSLTDSIARKHLKAVSVALDIDPPLTFHMFRKSGTTWAFQNGVPVQDLMMHGTWSSDAIWRYIKSVPSSSSVVSRTFKQHLSS